MSSQIFRAAQGQPAIVAGLSRGDYAPLHGWLAQGIYAHGRGSTPAQTLLRVARGPLDTKPYIADLTRKVADLVG